MSDANFRKIEKSLKEIHESLLVKIPIPEAPDFDDIKTVPELLLQMSLELKEIRERLDAK